MKENLLHYLWKFKKFDFSDLKTSDGEPVIIINTGDCLKVSGPDFFNAQLFLSGQKWAGNVEIHLKSSDWYIHHHEDDTAYENVILHVVWQHDTPVFRKNNTEIPVLELKKYVPESIIERYQSLVLPKSWIFCEKELASVDDFLLQNWLGRLFFERLERKSAPVTTLLAETNCDWESVLFSLLAKNFGLNTNGNAFFKMAQSFPFAVIRKESFEVENLEALLFGAAGLLDAEKEDMYFGDLKIRYHYLRQKYGLEENRSDQLEFFKHRPDNFPTIRLSQLANLYVTQRNLFSQLIAADSLPEIYKLFNIAASEYWQTHYLFDKESPKKKKTLTRSFVNLLIINTIIPIRFAYAQAHGKEVSEDLLSLLNEMPAESNAIIDKFSSFGIDVKSAFHSQSLLQLKNEYCSKQRCLECAVGTALLRS